jgi:hypothetical protein
MAVPEAMGRQASCSSERGPGDVVDACGVDDRVLREAAVELAPEHRDVGGVGSVSEPHVSRASLGPSSWPGTSDARTRRRRVEAVLT